MMSERLPENIGVGPMVWLKPGILAVYGVSLDASEHGHYAIQVGWPRTGSSCRGSGRPWERPFIITSGVPHELQMEEGWVLLIEPQTWLGEKLEQHVDNDPSGALEAPPARSPLMSEDSDDLVAGLMSLFQQNGMRECFLRQLQAPSLPGKIAHPRIRQLLGELDKCLPGVCLKPPQWRASTVAASLALSESRFLHLFREQMGIAWRPYLLWRRMLCAVGVLTMNGTASEAAHTAGFSDSSHLSRTFRRFFGLSIRQATHLFVHRKLAHRA